MEMIDCMEREAARLLERQQANFQRAHELAYRLLTLLVGGGAALGSYVLTQWAQGARGALWWALLAVALWWFAVAGYLLMGSMRSRRLSDGGRPSVLGERFVEEGGTFSGAADGAELLATKNTRLGLLARRDLDIGEYRTAAGTRMRALDRAYLAMAASPLIAAAALGVYAIAGGVVTQPI